MPLSFWFSTKWLRLGNFLVFDKFSNVAFITRGKPHISQYLTPSRKQNLQFCTESIKVPQFLDIYCSESCKSQRIYPTSTAPEMLNFENVLLFNQRFVEEKLRRWTIRIVFHVWIYNTIHRFNCFSFFSENIEARIKNEVIFKFCVFGAVEKCPYF